MADFDTSDFDPFQDRVPDRGKAASDVREVRAERLERTAIGLFCALGGFVAGAILTIIIMTQGA
jgi:hypothetical protein